MVDRPILFSAPMVRALLAGTKTQTRRTLKPQPPEWATFCQQPQALMHGGVWRPSGLWSWSEPEQSPLRPLRRWPIDNNGEHYWLNPRFAVGDRLWVKETWRTWRDFDEIKPTSLQGEGAPVFYEADRDNCDRHGKARVSIHMPRWASRLTLTVTDVRVERLQDISEEDAIAEGIYCTSLGLGGLYSIDRPGDKARGGATITRPAGWEKARHAYLHLWERINGKDSWDANPWVVAVSFDVRKGNIDA